MHTSIEIVEDSYPDAELTIDGEIPDTQVNGSELLRSVFENILRNAIQHKYKEQPVAIITAKRENEVVSGLIR